MFVEEDIQITKQSEEESAPRKNLGLEKNSSMTAYFQVGHYNFKSLELGTISSLV